tara:strand:- start:252 stop:635 length:384 start_codon:yes stop_codon:yes gene_type:complete
MYKLYRNLNAKGSDRWSLKLGTQPVDHAECIYAENVTIKQPSGQGFTKCLAGGHRAVFAWFKSDNAITDNIPALPANAVRINFNPKNGDQWFHVNGVKVDTLKQCYLLNDGTAWGVLFSGQVSMGGF